jgi:hypothetical protein
MPGGSPRSLPEAASLPEHEPRNGIDTSSREITRARPAVGAQNGVMFRTAARLLLLRVLPRRILPIVTIAEAILLIRSVRRKKRVAVNEPSESRTAPPLNPTESARDGQG